MTHEKKLKKMIKRLKNWNPFDGGLLCAMACGKNDKLTIPQKKLIFHFSSAMHDFFSEAGVINKIVNSALTIFT